VIERMGEREREREREKKRPCVSGSGNDGNNKMSAGELKLNGTAKMTGSES
jgi:hypothetical protein